MLGNFQDGVKGSNKGQTGFLRIVNMDITKKCVSVETYSPYLKKYRTDKRNKFSFVNVDF